MSEETTRIEAGAAVAADGEGTTLSGDRPNAGDNTPPRSTSRWTWQGALALATAFTGASAVLLHLIGSALHQAYFSQWGIDTGPFPKSSDWLVIMGYYGIWGALASALLDAFKNWYVVLVACMGLVLAIWLPLDPQKPPNAIYRCSRWIARLPKLVRGGLALLFGGAVLCIVAMWTMATLFVFIGIPAKIGRSVGEEIVRNEIEDFAKGCEASKQRCIRLLREGAPVGEGYLLESSQSHVALFDVPMQRVRVVLRENLELQPMRPPVVK